MPYEKNKTNNPITIVQKQFSPIISIVLLLKPRMIKSMAFYCFVTFIKFTPFLILTSNFSLNKSNTEITKLFRYLSIYSFIEKGMSTLNYSILCFSIGLFELIYFISLIYYYNLIKIRKRLSEININIIVIIILHLNCVLAQMFCEFLSFKLSGIFFGDAFPIKSSSSVAFQGVVSAVNVIVILLINGSNYLIFLTVNTPFYKEDEPVRVKVSIQRFIFCVVVENLIIIECFELFLEGNALVTYKITISAIIILSFTMMFFSLLNKYNYRTPVNTLMAFLSAYSVFSLIIEIILYLTNYYKEGNNVGVGDAKVRSTMTYLKGVFVFFWKLVISALFTSFSYSISDNILISHLKNNLFKLYENKINVNAIDDFYLLFDELITLRDAKASSFLSDSSSTVIGTHKNNRLLNMILEHKKDCLIDDCKCKIIQLIPDNTLNKTDFLKSLISRIGFLFETSVVQLDYSIDFNLSMLIAEYFSLFKSNHIMAYSIVQTCLNTNYKKLDTFQIILFYSLTNKYVSLLNKEMDKEHFDFINSYYKHYKSMKDMNKMMLSFTESYEKLVACKENFESTLKIGYEYDSKEISYIQSSFLTSEHLNLILSVLDRLKSLFGKIIMQSITNLKNNKMPFEYSIKIYLYFYVYNCKKIPKQINRLLEKEVHYLSENRSVTPSAIEKLLKYYYSSKSYSHNIIIKCHKGFKIELFSEKLAFELGYNHSSLLGEEMSILFPHYLRECHQKAMIHYFISNHNMTINRKTHIFTSNGQSIPIELRASSIPGLAKDYLMICNVNLLKRKSKYSFMLTHVYDTISLSNSFDVYYSLSLPIVKKFNINLLELFDIQLQSQAQSQLQLESLGVNKVFEKELMEIETIKKNFTLNPVEMFSELLYHSSQMINDIDTQNRKFKVLDLQNNEKNIKESNVRKSQLDINHFINTKKSLITDTKEGCGSGNGKGTRSKSKITLKRSKLLVVQNILKLIAIFNEFEVYDEEYKKLNEALYKFKNSLNGISMENTGKMTKKGLIEYTKECNSDYYIIKIKLRLIYDTPIYLITLKEKNANCNKQNDVTTVIAQSLSLKRMNTVNSPLLVSNQSNNTNTKSTPVLIKKTNSKTTNHSGNSIKNQFQSSSTKNVLFPYTSTTVNGTITDGNSNSNTNVNLALASIQSNKKTLNALISSSSSSNTHSKKDTNYSRVTKQDMIKIERKNNNLIISLNIALLISICISIILFILQRYMLETCQSIFLTLCSLLHQRDKLLHLMSSSLTLLFKHTAITNMDYPLEDFIDLFKNTTHYYEESYHYYYQTVTYYKTLTSEEKYNEIIADLPFNKIQGNWVPIAYTSDFFSESYYLSFTALQSVQYEFELKDKIKQDVDMLMFDKYLKDPEKEIESFLPILLYFLQSNYDTTFMNYFDMFRSNIDFTFMTNRRVFSTIYLVVEFIGLGNYFLIFGLVMYYLNYNNKLIFRSILKMFLNPYQNENSSYQNQYENFALKQIIDAFSKVIRNFQKDIIIDFLNKFNKSKKKRVNLSAAKSSFINLNSTNNNHHQSNSNDTNPTLHNNNNNNNDSNVSRSKLPPTSGQAFITKGPSSLLNKTSFTKSNLTQSSLMKIKETNSTYTNNTNEEGSEYSLNSSKILSKTQTVGVKAIKLLYIFLLILFIIMLLFFIIKVYNSLSFLTKIHKLFNDFSIVSSYYSNVFLYFNTIRIILLSPSKGNKQMMQNASVLIDQSRNSIDKLSIKDLSEFQLTSEYYAMLVIENNSSDFNAERLCSNNTWCIEQMTQSNNVVTKGVNIGVNVMLQSFVNIFNDFIKRNEVFDNVEDIQSLINVREFTSMESIIGFGITKVHETLYSLFYIDAVKIKEEFLLKVNLFNAGSLVYSLIVFTIVLFAILLRIRKKLQVIIYVVYKFNRSLYFGSNPESEDM